MTYEEYIRAALVESHDKDFRDVHHQWQVIDADRSGRISWEELMMADGPPEEMGDKL